MPASVINQQFDNHNANRKYPLAGDATGIDQTESFVLPDDFLVYLDLPVHAGQDVNPARFFVYRIGAYGGGYSIIIGYQPASGDPVVVASASVPRLNFVRNSTYNVGGIGDFDDTSGKVTIGRLDNIDDQPAGEWTFDLAATRIDPDAIRPLIRGVSSISALNGDQRTIRAYGHVVFDTGTNMRIDVTQENDETILTFSAIDGEGTIDECVCEGDASPGDPIRTILGIRPTASGDFPLVADTCIEIENIGNGIRLKMAEGCGKPCCGCTELQRITSDLERLSAQAALVEGYVRDLQRSVDTMDRIVLGSRLNDESCVDCS